MSPALAEAEFRVLSADLAPALTAFFAELLDEGMDHHFHPHPFTAEQAVAIASHAGRDRYAVLLLEGRVIGYGMLRGWDEGYQIPSLGIAIAAGWRGTGAAGLLMHELHSLARASGATQVRLRVSLDNPRALGLYRRLGYQFAGEERGEMLGLLTLGPAAPPPNL